VVSVAITAVICGQQAAMAAQTSGSR